MKKLKVAQIGVGFFGASRRDRMRESGLFDLVAAYDLNADAMAQAEAQDGAKPCASYEDMLDTPGLEGVVISTGAKFHAEQMLQAMRRGLPVFVEKPLCATPDEMRDLLRTQRETGVAVGMGHADHSTEKYSRRIKELIDSGEIGTVVAVEATTCHSGGMVIKEGDWRGDPARNPGGMLFQCGVHKLHELMYFCGPITKVSAMMRYDANLRTGTADAALTNLQFESGVLGSLNAYHITPYKHYTYIYGTKANLYLNQDHHEHEQLTIQYVPEGFDGSREMVQPVVVDGETDHCGNLRAWYEAITNPGGAPLYPSLLDGARAVAIVFAAEEAAKSGRTVDVGGLMGEK